MKHLKMLGLAAMAAALMALAGAGAASAENTELYSGNTTLNAGTEIHASLESGSSATLKSTSGALTDTCLGSTVKGKTDNATGGTVTGKISALLWENCDDRTETVAGKEGSLSITKITGTDNGTLSGSGSVVEVEIAGVVCLYGTGTGTHLGTVTGKTGASEQATIDVNATILEQEPKKLLCPDTTKWEANYLVTSPLGLNVRT